MCKRLIFLISFVALLGLVNSVSADDIDWTNCGATDSWCDPNNWDGGEVPGSGDTAVLRCGEVACGPPERGPIIDCDVDVEVIRGPGWEEEGECDQVMDIVSGNVLIGEWERDRDRRDANMTVNISGDAHITVAEDMRFPDYGETFLNITSGDVTLNVLGDLRGADEDDGRFWCSVSSGTVTVAGEMSIGDAGSGMFDFSGGSITCNDVVKLVGRRSANPPTVLKVRGSADVTVNGDLEIQEDDDGSAELHMEGGTCTISGMLGVGLADGSATVNVSGGVLTAGEVLAPENNDSKGATINVTGGLLVCGDLELGNDGATGALIISGGTVQVGASSLEINDGGGINIMHTQGTTGGTLVLAGDKQDQVAELAADDKILAHSYRASLIVVYDGGEDKTIVTATEVIPCQAWLPTPKNGAVEQGHMTTCLSWENGDNAFMHYLFFGDDFDDVSTHTSFLTVPGRGRYRQAENTDICPPSFNRNEMDLENWTVYYWRVDEVARGQPPCRGKVWSFTTGCELIPGDLNLDCQVDLHDVALLGDEYGDNTYWPHP